MKTKSGKPLHAVAEEIRQQFLGHPESNDAQSAELRVVLYSHDTMGIGHMRRNLLIAQLIKERFENVSVLAIAGAKEANVFSQSAGIDCLTLPSFQKRENGTYTTRNLGIPAKDILDVRSGTILAAIQSYKPDLLIADKIPSGAGGELLPSLQWLSQHTNCRCVLGLREILDTAEKVIRNWDDTHSFEIIRKHFGSIWIYGDPTVYNAVEEYEFPPDIAERVSFTGYLDTRIRLTNRPKSSDLPAEPYVLCTVGGGQDAHELPLKFIEAIRMNGQTAVLLTGPFMPEPIRTLVDSAAADVPSLKVLEFVDEGDLLIKNASHVISMGGYNSLAAIMSFNKPSLIVPRVTPREEQLIRANRLADLGVVDAIHPRELTPELIVNWLASTNQPARPAAATINMDGLHRIGELIHAEFPKLQIRKQ